MKSKQGGEVRKSRGGEANDLMCEARKEASQEVRWMRWGR